MLTLAAVADALGVMADKPSMAPAATGESALRMTLCGACAEVLGAEAAPCVAEDCIDALRAASWDEIEGPLTVII